MTSSTDQQKVKLVGVPPFPESVGKLLPQFIICIHCIADKVLGEGIRGEGWG